MFAKYLTLLILLSSSVYSQEDPNSATHVLTKFFSQCAEKDELIKCLKIQALKVADRALHIKSFNLVDGITIVGNDRLGKSLNGLSLNETKLQTLSDDDLDSLLGDRASKFLDTHKVEVNVPQVVEEGRRRGGGGGGGGGGKGQGQGYGAMLWALAIKGSFLAMAYKGIAVMSGTALIIGKMALLLSAILGLKKLVSGGEKTTFEIIKQPKYTEEHVHSSGYEDDHDHYRRNYLETGEAQKKVYRFQIPYH